MEGSADQTHSSRASSPRGLEDEEEYGDEDDVIHESDKEDDEEYGEEDDEHAARQGDGDESEEADEERAARRLRRWRVHAILSLVVLLVVLLSAACGCTMSVVVLLSHVVEVDRTNGLEFATRVVFFAGSCAGLVYVAMHVYVARLGFGSSSRRVIPSHVPLVAVLAQFLSVLAVLAWLAAVAMRSIILLKFGGVSFAKSTAGLLEVLVSAGGVLSSANLILLIETSDRPFATAIISPHWFIHRLPVDDEEQDCEEEEEEEEEGNDAQDGLDDGRRQSSTRREAPKRTFSVISSTADGRSGRGRDSAPALENGYGQDGRNDVPPMPAIPDMPYMPDMPALQSARSSWATTVWDGRDPRDDFAWRPVMDLASLRQSGVTSFDSLPTPGASRPGSRAATPAESAVGGTSPRANKGQDTEPPMPQPRMSMMPRPRPSLPPPPHFIPPLPPMPPFTYNPYMPYTPMHTPPPMPPSMASRPVSMAPSRRLSIPLTVMSNPGQYPPPSVNLHLPAFRPDAPDIERDDGDREHGDAPRPLDTRLLSPTSVIAGFAPPRPRTSMARERPDLRRMSTMSSSARSWASGPPPSMRSWASGPVPSARGSVYTVRPPSSYHSAYNPSRESRWADPRWANLPAVREERTPPGWPRRYGPPPPNPWGPPPPNSWGHYPPPRTPTGPGPWGPGPRYQSPGPSNFGPMPYPPRMPPGHAPYPPGQPSYPPGHASYPPRTPPGRMMTPPAWAPMPRQQSPGPGRPMFLPPRTPPGRMMTPPARSVSPAPTLDMPPMPDPMFLPPRTPPGRMTPPPDMAVPPMPPIRLMNPPVRKRTPSPTNMLPPIPPMPPIQIMTSPSTIMLPPIPPLPPIRITTPPPTMMMPTPTRSMTPPVRMRTPPQTTNLMAPDSPTPSFNFSRPRTAAAAVMQARLGRRVQAAQAQASVPAEMYEIGVEDDFAVVLEPRPRTSAARLMHHAVGRRLLAAGQ